MFETMLEDLVMLAVRLRLPSKLELKRMARTSAGKLATYSRLRIFLARCFSYTQKREGF